MKKYLSILIFGLALVVIIPNVASAELTIRSLIGGSGILSGGGESRLMEIFSSSQIAKILNNMTIGPVTGNHWQPANENYKPFGTATNTTTGVKYYTLAASEASNRSKANQGNSFTASLTNNFFSFPAPLLSKLVDGCDRYGDNCDWPNRGDEVVYKPFLSKQDIKFQTSYAGKCSCEELGSGTERHYECESNPSGDKECVNFKLDRKPILNEEYEYHSSEYYFQQAITNGTLPQACSNSTYRADNDGSIDTYDKRYDASDICTFKTVHISEEIKKGILPTYCFNNVTYRKYDTKKRMYGPSCQLQPNHLLQEAIDSGKIDAKCLDQAYRNAKDKNDHLINNCSVNYNDNYPVGWKLTARYEKSVPQFESEIRPKNDDIMVVSPMLCSTYHKSSLVSSKSIVDCRLYGLSADLRTGYGRFYDMERGFGFLGLLIGGILAIVLPGIGWMVLTSQITLTLAGVLSIATLNPDATLAETPSPFGTVAQTQTIAGKEALGYKPARNWTWTWDPLPVIPSTMTLNLTAPATIESTQDIRLSYSAAGATSLTASATPADSAWTGNLKMPPENDTEIVSVGKKDRGEYKFVLTGKSFEGTEGIKTVAVKVIQLPDCSFSANPAQIKKGESSTLSWNCQYTDSTKLGNIIANILSNIVNVAKIGSQQVKPAETTNYNLTATNVDGSKDYSATVVVGESDANWWETPWWEEILPR